MSKMTIEQLAQQYNKLIKGKGDNQAQDKRYSPELTSRRIRDYVSKGIIDKPEREGKYAFYNERHLNQLLSVRAVQKEGFSDSSLQKYGQDIYNAPDFSSNEMISSCSFDVENNDELKNKAQAAFQNIINQKSLSNEMPTDSIARSTPTFQKETVDKWALDNTVAINIKSGTTLTEHEIETITKQFNQILKENYHD